VRETTSLARTSAVEVCATYCESHTTDVPFYAASGLLRAALGVEGLEDAQARARVRERLPGADPQDLVLLDDMLGIGDPAVAAPEIDSGARHTRVAAIANMALLGRTTPTVYIIEDVHWIDSASELMLAEFGSAVRQTHSLVLLAYRPEYDGALAHASRCRTIVLEPLDDSQMSTLSAELLGKDPSIGVLAEVVVKRAGGNPFFAEEIVRDFSERDVLIGGRGCYLCVDPVAEESVPSTLQAVIAARIDRLNPAAKRTLNAAAVIGSRFDDQTLTALGIDPALADLIRAELIDQTSFRPHSEYAFRHPLIRAVAYESQLKSARAQLHRRLAGILENSDQNAALIAEHLEAAGDLHAVYDWPRRA
jgi:adenylate cyclase